jgi:hypothetical protein
MKEPNFSANLSNYNVKGCTKDTLVKITKGFQKDCRGKISGCTIDGVYFIRIEWCQREPEGICCPINLFLPDEFEVLD